MSDDSDACAADFAEHTRHLFVDVAQARAIAAGGRPALRAVFRKVHGVASGWLRLAEDRPDWTRHGIFAGNAYRCWTRFSSDIPPDAGDEENGTLGLGIKLFGASSPSLAVVDPEAPTADLLFQNHDVFFVDTGADMCRFTDLSLKGRAEEWFEVHPETKQILADMAKHEDSVLTATYSSTLPYACGAATAVKYRLVPQQAGPSRAEPGDKDRLRTDLRLRLGEGPAAFAFELQRPEPGFMPDLDCATQHWPEADAPFVSIGTLVLDQQDVTAEGQGAYGENLAFSPWRVPEANRPLGSIAESRRAAYPSSAAQRHKVNGIPEAEPHRPR